MREIGNIVFIKGDPIEVTTEEFQSVMKYLFGCQVLIAKTNSGCLVGEILLDDDAKEETVMAARNWTRSFSNRNFVNEIGILTTFFDCILEQRDEGSEDLRH